MRAMTDSPISFPGLFGDWEFTISSKALDIANGTGTPIYAADGGTVTYAGWNGGYGLLIKIEHNNTPYVTYYAHCSALYVSVGDHVYKGEHIAAMGSTGNSTGSHLHFGILKNNTWVNPLNYVP